MDFQAEVATWAAAHLLARLPIGGRFGLINTALPIEMRLETDEGLDDTHIILDDGSWIDLQSKTTAGLSPRPSSPLGKTIAQLARLVSASQNAGKVLEPAKVRAVLSVGVGAPQSLNDLERGCRAFDLGGSWADTKAQRSKAESDALELFETHARTAWSTLSTRDTLTDDDLVLMARLFRIVRFSMDEGDDNWREASRIIGARLYGSDASGDAPLRDLKAIVRDLIGSGAPANRTGLLRALRARGHNDVGAPDYDADLGRIAAASDAELERLAVHTHLPIAGGIPIPRESAVPLATAIASGSLIVVGEPGAGKTGALVALARSRRDAGQVVVFLSVDRFPGVGIASDLQSELHLDHPLVDVLAAAPGAEPKLLVVDALDAARGGPAEGVFAQLIEQASMLAEAGWIVAASIRTFDLRNGRRFRDAMRGSPLDPAFSDPSLGTVRHFQIPRLTDADLTAAGTHAPALDDLLTAAPGMLRDLLRNVFNLSLAAQLITDGATPDSIRTVSTQSDLIDAYEDRRLIGTSLQQAAAAAVNEMIRRRRLAIRKVVIGHERLDDVVRSGVLSDAGDLVSFSHHVLFDHVAGRFFLDWDDPLRLIGQLGGDSSIALMLAPGLRFAVERLWRSDRDGKSAVWHFIADVYSAANVDPVLANVALRTAIERVGDMSDIEGLVGLLTERGSEETIATMLSRLARFVGLAVDATGAVAADEAIAWATIAEVAANAGSRALSDASHSLLMTLSNKSDLAQPLLLGVFGRAARSLLTLAWAANPPMQITTTNAIRFVGKSFASDPVASRALLDRALRDPHFSAHADKEATWLAEQIMPIARADPDFAVEIFRVLYSRDITDDSTSFMGGQPSRIMALSSNRRQDYRGCRYNLAGQSSQLLELSAKWGTRAAIEAAIGDADREAAGGYDRNRIAVAGLPTFDLVGSEHGFNSWDDPGRYRPDQNYDVLTHYVTFLRGCSIDAFAESIEAAASGYSSPAVWARILGVGAARVVDVVDLLWPYATNPNLLAHEDIVRDAVRFLAAAYSNRSVDERRAFEVEALRTDLFDDERERRWWRHTLARLLSMVDETALATDAMRVLRTDLAAANELGGNPPLRSVMTSWGSNRGVARSLLSSEGVNVDEGVDARMLAQSEALYELVQATPSDGDADKLAELWSATVATITLFDAHAGELHERVEQPVWGHISNAAERLAGSNAYEPGKSGLPTIEEFLALLRRLWSSRFPEPKEDEAGLSWGNWEVRIYAASSYVGLAARFGAEQREIVEIFTQILADPVPQVRLQAAQNLQVLSQIAPEQMWRLAEGIGAKETHEGVLGSFLHSVLSRFTWQEVDRCEAIIETVMARFAADQTVASDRDGVATPLGHLCAQLWCWQGRSTALGWLTRWSSDLVKYQEVLTSFLSMLREAFFARYASSADEDQELSDRAQRAAMVVLRACSAAAVQSYATAVSEVSEKEVRDEAVARYRAAESVISFLMNQLYFGSGAYEDSRDGEAVGLGSADAMRLFLVDYDQMLVLLANSHEPATHHHLVELYEFLIPGDPAKVFDALHALLVGAGAREGYHYEGLAAPVIVRMITRYIADHRSIFEDDARRARLVQILRLFSDVGWLEALKLLYDLPELLR
ncbi:ATP-binding protein [Bradyrhizobium pachyrhizi]|uniref:ATP-binding protein n=1 Tax=Bradyrhizobium pachyrhizi TaxID=280333 RepID=UPI001FD25F18|nr:ATP-binding protein [Bradyrhizobium pachyrhizi]